MCVLATGLQKEIIYSLLSRFFLSERQEIRDRILSVVCLGSKLLFVDVFLAAIFLIVLVVLVQVFSSSFLIVKSEIAGRDTSSFSSNM